MFPHHMSLEAVRTAVRHGLTLVSTDAPNPSYIDPVLMLVTSDRVDDNGAGVSGCEIKLVSDDDGVGPRGVREGEMGGV